MARTITTEEWNNNFRIIIDGQEWHVCPMMPGSYRTYEVYNPGWEGSLVTIYRRGARWYTGQYESTDLATIVYKELTDRYYITD